MTLTFLTDAVEPFSYPGGEVSVKMPSAADHALWKFDSHRALLQGADANDLLRLAMWGQNTSAVGGAPIAYVPYLPGARADHEERPMGFDCAIYAEILNSGNFAEVWCVDPHSLIMPMLIDRCRILETSQFIRNLIPKWDDLAGVIIPDDGAVGRASRVAVELDVPTFQARKHRDFATGKLSGFSCDPLPDRGVFLVVDDICDGGGTFMGLAEATGLDASRLKLWVTHGIFSGRALEVLPTAYSEVFTTTSHPGVADRVADLPPDFTAVDILTIFDMKE